MTVRSVVGDPTVASQQERERAAIVSLTDSTGGALDGTLAAVPAGGTGAAAGGWDTAVNRDAAITAINDNFADLAGKVAGILTVLRQNNDIA